MKTVLTIAGSDCSGGAGIQADLKTIAAHKLFGMSAITALTAENTVEVRGIQEAAPEFVALQMDCVFEDIPPDAVKIGMVCSSPIIEAVAANLQKHHAVNIVVDPVMVATCGGKLISDDAIETLIARLAPLADLLTPNLPEAECFCGFPIRCADDMLRAAQAIAPRVRGAVLIKGGHLSDTADDLLYRNGEAVWLRTPRVDNPNTHGTGCTLSSAIACGLAAGHSLEQSVREAKSYITGALKAGLNLGRGSGPMDHGYATKIVPAP